MHAMLDAARLADELRAEQEHVARVDHDRKVAEAQIKDLQIRIDDVESAALKHGKRACTKLEGRIKELENELDAEQRRLSDATKTLRKSERKIKELDFKRQIEEAEEIAALNLAKFRKAQAEAEEAEERAGLNEQAMSKLRVMGRAGSAAPFL